MCSLLHYLDIPPLQYQWTNKVSLHATLWQFIVLRGLKFQEHREASTQFVFISPRVLRCLNPTCGYRSKGMRCVRTL
ncbi:hypothetical protein V6N12_062436 [Hibiscus sabdariffa]|uniref:Uncharacterized protein n=1 Tax=Hibiscus sabdariffa TaxID=183260 RepID=A0ABR2F8X3_9ROSI